jgi:hypothetical protein
MTITDGETIIVRNVKDDIKRFQVKLYFPIFVSDNQNSFVLPFKHTSVII